MRRVILIAACLLILQSVAPPFASTQPKDPQIQKNGPPGSFLPKYESKVIFHKEAEFMLVSSHKATLEEILQKIVDEIKISLKFYCYDPAVKPESIADLKVTGSFVVELLGGLLPDETRFVLINAEGNPVESEEPIATVNIYSAECAAMDRPVRVFLARPQDPLFIKPPQEISLEELWDVLRTGGPASRRRAADILGSKDEDAIPCAKEALKDENRGVMLAAAKSLRILGEKYGSQKVASAVFERFQQRPIADFLPFMAVMDKEEIWPVFDGLMNLTGEDEQSVIERSLFLTNDRRAIKYLSKIASDSDRESSKQAVYAIGKIGGPEAVADLRRLLKDKDIKRQAWAAQAVHFLPNDDGSAARKDVEKLVKRNNVSDELLRGLAQVSYFEPLEKLMKDRTAGTELKVRALKALAASGATQSMEVVQAGLDDKAPTVRFTSVEAMLAISMEEAIPSLVKAAADKDAAVRTLAVKGLADMPKDDIVVEALGKAAFDKDEKVRKQAVDSLERLGKPNAAMKIVLNDCKSKNKDPYVANKAGAILRNWGLE